MNTFRITFLLFLLPTICSSQIVYSIKGEVETSGDFAPSGNIIALQLPDSNFIKGNFFVDGQFVLEGLTDKEMLLQFTSLEFEDAYFRIRHNNEPIIDMGIIKLNKSNIALDEIVVESRRPVYVHRADGTLSVLVENSTLAASNSVSEILSKSPEVLVDEEGSVTVFGKGDAIIYWNGKRISNEQLPLISPSNIKKIEVIRNPSAKYDADGGAVINIISIKNNSEGYQVNLKQNVSYSKFAGMDTYSSVNLNLSKGRFSSNANYSLTQGKDRHILNTTRNRAAEEVFLKTDLTTEWKNQYENYSFYDIGLQYDYKKDSYLSLQYSGYYKDLGGNQLSDNTIEDIQSISYYESDIKRNEKNINHNISINYQQSLDTMGSSLFLGAQYSDFDFQNNNSIDENSIELNNSSSRELKNLAALDIYILSAQADYTKVFKDKHTLETGVKYSQSENESDVQLLVRRDDNTFELDEDLSNQFQYQESVAAAYLSFKSKLNETLNYSIGLRTEFTKYHLKFSQVEDQLISDQYIDFFPNVSLTKTMSDNYSLSFSYAAGITRVPYQRLNPVLYYQDPYTSIQGNPESVPEKSHFFEINSKLKNTTFKVGYNYTIDPFGGGALRGEDNKSYVLKRVNFDKRHEYFASASRTFNGSWFSSTNTLSLRYIDIIDTEFNFESVGSKPNLYFHSNNRIPVADLFDVELMFYYLGKKDEGVYQRWSSWNVTLSLEKSFFDKALKCRLIANDIFRSVRAAGTYSIGETDIYFHRHWNSNYLRLSIMYNFGKLGNKGYKNKAIGKSESDRVR